MQIHQQKNISDFLNEIFNQIDFDKLEKLTFHNTKIEDIEANIDKKINQIWIYNNENPQRFLQTQDKETINPLTVVKNLGSDELFSEKKSDPNDIAPEPNTKEGETPCNNPTDCLKLQLQIMKYIENNLIYEYIYLFLRCTLIRLVMRMLYEMLCAIENFFAEIVQKICACTATDS